MRRARRYCRRSRVAIPDEDPKLHSQTSRFLNRRAKQVQHGPFTGCKDHPLRQRLTELAQERARPILHLACKSEATIPGGRELDAATYSAIQRNPQGFAELPHLNVQGRL